MNNEHMSEEQFLISDPSIKKSSNLRRRKVGGIWILIGVLCLVAKRVIRFIDFNVMMKHGIEKGISAGPLWFLSAHILWSTIATLCFIIGFMFIFLDFEKIKEKIKSIKNAEDSDSNNSRHY